MVKTKLQMLEEIYDKVFAVAVDAEIQVDFMKTQDPKKIIYPNKEYTVAGIKMKKDISAEMIVVENEAKIKNDYAILEIIKNKIEEERGKISDRMSPSPHGSVS